MTMAFREDIGGGEEKARTTNESEQNDEDVGGWRNARRWDGCDDG